MEYLRGWRALRSDPEWGGKILTATCVFLTAMCIPVVGQIVLVGWNALMLRRAVSGQDAPLPRMDFDFDYLSKLLNVGFKGFLAQLLWSLPLYVIAMAFGCCFYAGVFGSAMAGGAAGGEAGAGVGMLCAMVGMMFAWFAVIIFISMPMQVAIIRAELSDDVNAALKFKEVIEMTKLVWRELLIGMFVMGLLAWVCIFGGMLLFFVGMYPAMVVFLVIQSYWRAEVYRVYLEKGGQPLPIGPLDVEGGNLASVQQQPPAQF